MPEGPEAPTPPIDLSFGGPPPSLNPLADVPPPEAAAPEPAMPELDLGDTGALSEKNNLTMSVYDELVPIKVKNIIDKNTSILNEKSASDGEDEKLTEFEAWQKEKNSKQKKEKEKREKYKNTQHLFSDNMVNRYQDTRKRNTDPMYGVKADLNSDIKYRSESLKEVDNFNIEEYLDNKIIKNAELTNRIKSTLNRFGDRFDVAKNKNIIISETFNSSGEKNDEN